MGGNHCEAGKYLLEITEANMLPGETILSGASPICPDCNKYMQFKVMSSPAGFYIGTSCCLGPYSRESEYLTQDEAEKTLADWREELMFHRLGYSDGGLMLAHARY